MCDEGDSFESNGDLESNDDVESSEDPDVDVDWPTILSRAAQRPGVSAPPSLTSWLQDESVIQWVQSSVIQWFPIQSVEVMVIVTDCCFSSSSPLRCGQACYSRTRSNRAPWLASW